VISTVLSLAEVAHLRLRMRQDVRMLDNRSMPPSAVIPVLNCPDVVAASAWLRSAFGFLERLAIGGHRIQLSYGSGSLVLVNGPNAPANVMVRVEDADAHCARARAAGATIVAEPADYPYGERQYTATRSGTPGRSPRPSPTSIRPTGCG
jgi:hypothetical protein